MPSFAELIEEMYLHPPDPNGPVPRSNHNSTMFGTTVPFHVLSWIAVFARLYVRHKVVREAWWDDHLVLVAAIFNVASLVGFLGSVPFGMGKHLSSVDQGALIVLFKYMYFHLAAYYTTTALVKLALLLQYVRMFRTGLARTFTITLLLFVGLWGCAFIFMAWFPCFPISGFWDRSQNPPAKCYGFGFGSLDGALAAFISFASTNMFFDTAIFITPLFIFFRPGLSRKEILGLSGLFTLGSVVVLMSILRLWTAVKNKNSFYDFTWFWPLTAIISCIEVDFAIICASIPIFWPVIMTSLTQIFVTKEVHVTHQRLDDIPASPEYELNNRSHSLKSMNSQEGLTKEGNVVEIRDLRGAEKTDYGNRLVRDHVTGKSGAKTEVGAGAWNAL